MDSIVKNAIDGTGNEERDMSLCYIIRVVREASCEKYIKTPEKQKKSHLFKNTGFGILIP